MAIEIVERGNLPEEKSYTAECNNCHYKMKFLRKDAKLTPDQRDGDFLTITCPVCSKPVHVSVR